MIRLADLAIPHTRSWTEAQDAFAWPTFDHYNIAEDCLSADPAKTALIAIDGDTTTKLTFAELGNLSSPGWRCSGSGWLPGTGLV
jgi:hypothetical protein